MVAEAKALGYALELEIAAVEAAISCVDRLPADTFMTLNVSPTSIMSPRLMETIGRVPLDRIIVEVTEHAPITDYPKLRTATRRSVAAGHAWRSTTWVQGTRASATSCSSTRISSSSTSA